MKIGPLTLTRESALWWIGLGSAVITGLATLDADTAVNVFGIPATWLAKLRLLSLIVGIGSAWAKTSPFPGRKDAAKVDMSKIAPVLLLATIALCSSSCAPKTARHALTVSVVSVHAVLGGLQDGEMVLVCGQPTAPAPPACVADAAHRRISGYFATAFDYDGRVARLVRAMPAGAPPSPEVASLLQEITALVQRILDDIPASPQKQQLVATVGGVR